MAKRKRPAATLAEKTRFKEDTETTNDGRNRALAALLTGSWQGLAIVSIRRIEIGPRKGGEATYRE